MQPQGTAPINTAQYTALQDRVNNATSCAELQSITTEILASLAANASATSAQQALLAPIAALMSPPSSPSDVVTWISGFITHVLGPLYAPQATYTAQLTAQATQMTALLAAVSSKAGTFPDCTITT